MQDTWAARDLPVLDAAVRLFEDNYEVHVADIATQTGFDANTVAASLDALEGEYVVEAPHPTQQPSSRDYTSFRIAARRFS